MMAEQNDSMQTVFVIDDDADVRDSLQVLLTSAGFRCLSFVSAQDFLARGHRALPRSGCVIVDVRLPDMDGLTLQREMVRAGIKLPVVFLTGFAAVPLAVQAMKAGAVDFVEKPCPPEQLLAAVRRALSRAETEFDRRERAMLARERIERLTRRERDVLAFLVAGASNKSIAASLSISPRTVEIHRARVMEKTEVRSLSELVRLAMAAEEAGASNYTA
jgi:two-component system response regulator FixJ